MKRILSLDIGGSAVKYGLVSETGELLQSGSFPTPDALDPLVSSVQELFESSHPDGLAISSPGCVNIDTGVVSGLSAVPWLHGPSLKELFGNLLHTEVQVENDANCAALAELWLGEAKEANSFSLVVFGTGIGGTFVADRKILRGAHNQAGEFGLMFTDFSEDPYDWHIWSMYSTVHTAKRAAEEAGIDPKDLDGVRLFAEAEENPLFQKYRDRFYRSAAVGLMNLQSLYDPEMILLGGGISKREDLIPGIEAEMHKIASGRFEGVFPLPRLVRCHFRSDANLIGAVYHFLTYGTENI